MESIKLPIKCQYLVDAKLTAEEQEKYFNSGEPLPPPIKKNGYIIALETGRFGDQTSFIAMITEEDGSIGSVLASSLFVTDDITKLHRAKCQSEE